MSKPIRFRDAQELAREHPDTFDAPSLSRLREQLKPGLLVKVCDGSERFWVILDTVEGDRLAGIIDNELRGHAGHGLNLGDRIEFEIRNVYDLDLPEGD